MEPEIRTWSLIVVVQTQYWLSCLPSLCTHYSLLQVSVISHFQKNFFFLPHVVWGQSPSERKQLSSLTRVYNREPLLDRFALGASIWDFPTLEYVNNHSRSFFKTSFLGTGSHGPLKSPHLLSGQVSSILESTPRWSWYIAHHLSALPQEAESLEQDEKSKHGILRTA